ncbi:MAG: hypothetical protein E7774_11125 [Bradyrhizobium sp.]|nr:MAG: hypothetical protein E7774_11125 [Bradyrhizobium sp.]
MDDLFKTFDALAILYWVVPGAFFILFRAFALKGSFPSLGKDDVVPFIIVSVLYWYLLIWVFAAFFGVPDLYRQYLTGVQSIVALVAVPSLLGVGAGLIERGDVVGRLLRAHGVGFLSPYATAWESLVVNLPAGSVLIVHLKDAEPIVGRWVNAQFGSAGSTDKEVRDLYLDEIGAVTGDNYQPFTPTRGAYVAADQIQFIEVISAAT